MRVVESADKAAAALESAQSEALKGFGRDECYVERYLTWPRHIEMQVFADTHGNARLARRARLLVPAPPPEADRGEPGRRTSPTRSARRWARPRSRWRKACGYVNAGTVEFLYQDGEFFFLEMNTRLQVEHPVTELVTGLDLVELQLRDRRRASRCRSAQDDIERAAATPSRCRINAENPAKGTFLPSPGTITTFRRPDGPGVRVDAGYDDGDTVSQYYDNLVAKLIVWGPDREHARAGACSAPWPRPRSRASPPRSPPTSPSSSTPTSSPASTRPSGSRSASTSPTAPRRRRRRRRDGEGKVARDVDVEVDGRRTR